MGCYLKQVIWKIRNFPEKVLLRKVWFNTSLKLLTFPPIQATSARIHKWVCDRQQREPESVYTRFLRNRPQLDVLSKIVKDWPQRQPFRIAVLGCSTGAELYSALWAVKSARPDLEIVAVGIDISQSAINTARAGEYELGSQALDGLSDKDMQNLFERHEGKMRIRNEITSDVSWRLDSLFNPELVQILGPQDAVFVNHCLVNFTNEDATRSFKNIVGAIVPNGYLFVSGMDLDLRTEETEVSGLKPVTLNIEEIHNAEEVARRIYPWKFWGLEPFEKSRPDWARRYSTVFQKLA